MARITFNGAAGTSFTNDTGRVLYQFHASLQNTCGVCLQYHLAVGPWWPIPIHRGCRCRQSIVFPGAQADPFIDFRELLRGMDPDQQTKAIGRSGFILVENGVVPWEEFVTRGRVRPLREVVSRLNLSVDQMVKAGVNPRIAANAHASVNTPAHVIARQHRQNLVNNLKQAGLSNQQIQQGFGSKMSERIGIAAGPSKAQRFQPQWTDGGSLAKFLGLNPKTFGKAVAVAKAAKSEPTVSLHDTTPREEFDEASNHLFGKSVDLKRVSDLGGAIEKADVTVSVSDEERGPAIYINATGKNYDFIRKIEKDAEGKTVLRNASFFVDESAQNQGIGRRVFAKQIETAQSLGVDRITTSAARGPHANGYYTWPRFGYNGPIPEAVLKQLPAELSQAKTVLDLMDTEAGQAFWKQHGVKIDLEFDLSPDSRSMKTWAKYLKSKTTP